MIGTCGPYDLGGSATPVPYLARQLLVFVTRRVNLYVYRATLGR
jgi:hypothetical protein